MACCANCEKTGGSCGDAGTVPTGCGPAATGDVRDQNATTAARFFALGGRIDCATCRNYAWSFQTMAPVRKTGLSGVHHPSCPKMLGRATDIGTCTTCGFRYPDLCACRIDAPPAASDPYNYPEFSSPGATRESMRMIQSELDDTQGPGCAGGGGCGCGPQSAGCGDGGGGNGGGGTADAVKKTLGPKGALQGVRVAPPPPRKASGSGALQGRPSDLLGRLGMLAGAGQWFLRPNEYLLPGQELTNGKFAARLQASDRNFAVYDARLALWSPGIAGRGAVILIMQGDGNLVAYGPGGRVIWKTDTAGNPGAWLAMQNDGNLVVRSRDGRALWSMFSVWGWGNVSLSGLSAAQALHVGSPGPGLGSPQDPGATAPATPSSWTPVLVIGGLATAAVVGATLWERAQRQHVPARVVSGGRRRRR